jgi:hypothetical protein
MSTLRGDADEQLVVYLQHDDPVVAIPFHISVYGLISAHFFLANSIVSLLHNYNSLSAFSLCLYITTLLFWNNLTHSGVIRIIDISTGIANILSITYYDSLWFDALYRELWASVLSTGCLIYLMNIYIFYCQTTPDITNDDQGDDQGDNQDNASLTKYSYFSIKYIPPNTYNRELAYYYSVFVHIIALHILPPVTCMYCIIYNDKSNYQMLH